MSKSICIISPDLVGPVKNGGIGTHCYYLAKTLSNAGFDVTVLFTGMLQNDTHDKWVHFYNSFNVSYCYISDKTDCTFHADAFTKTSFLVSEFLQRNHFDFIHFQEWLANGLVSIQLKETTNAFDNSCITITMHSSTQWQQEGMMQHSQNPVYDMKLKWAEEYCVRHCDIVLSPSEYMFAWAKNANWQLAEKQKIIPYCYSKRDNSKPKIEYIDTSHLIFFGRLETRKGLEYFVESVLKLENIEQVSFLGKISQTSEGLADQYIKVKLSNIDYKIYSDFDTFEALEFIKKEKGLVIIPSLVDNYPYTIIEMVENNIPFVCSNTGGMPEMVDERVLFDISDKGALVALLKNAHTIPFGDLDHQYNAKEADQTWINLHDSLTRPTDLPDNSEPLISICIPYYNYPKYMPLLLASIDNIEYQNYELIVINDGSPQEEANRVFEEMREKYKQHTFLHKENSGVGDTRNYAASKAKGEYLIFMDSDNLAYPNMIVDYLYAMRKSKADCITCYFAAFDESFEGVKPDKVLYKYLPLGAAKESGILENVFGDANFIIKKDVFKQISGFGTERHTSWEDWEILAKLNLNGFTQKVIPKPLFWYRHTEAGFSRNTNQFNNHQRIIRCYQQHYQGDTNKLITGYVIPFFYKEENNLATLNHLINKMLPINSARRKIAKKIVKGVFKK